MGRVCAECGDWSSCSQFSSNQWRKGEGYSRCRSCVNPPPPPVYECGICHREFGSQNSLQMHMQVHRPKKIACPVCGDRRFGSGANAVQHVESGFCRGCRGSDNAREQIYKFALQQRGMRQFMTDHPMLTNGNNNRRSGGVPDYPYECRLCNRAFRQMSQLLQHNDQKHNNHPFMIGM
mmetsp:Transcript_27794/g.59433  ORF Transcript_27794/g.59433 Transcript_27794/m.59433 type:complete len:178 (+) Transcript_27794:275-808(+)